MGWDPGADGGGVIASLLAALVLASTSGAPTLPVSAASGCAVTPTRTELVSGAWACTITAAEQVALPGDTVSVAAGTYPPARITASGTEAAPIIVSAVPGSVLIDAGLGRNGLGISGVHDVEISGIDVRGGSAQAVWVSASQRVSLISATVSESAVHGVQVANSQDVVIASSTIISNQSTGIMETGADSGDIYSTDIVSGNGTGGPQYLGSGIEVGGTGTQIIGCTITHNGLSKLYEHGVYVAAVADSWLISGSTISGSSGADVKAAGSNGTIVSSTLGSARLGVYATGTGVTLSQVHISGSFLNGLVVAGGSTLLSHSVISNAAAGYGKQAHAAFVYGAGHLQITASTLLLRGVPVKPYRGG
jgi:hypothetical protein